MTNNSTNPNSEWFQYPTGKIPVGTYCPECGRYNTRCMTVSIIGLNNQNQVVMIQRKQDPEAGAWALPGGYVDWDETLIEAARREFGEETGLQLADITFLGLYDDIHRDKDGRQNVDHCYVGHVLSPQSASIQVEEILDLDWFAFPTLPHPIAFDHRQMLEDYYGR